MSITKHHSRSKIVENLTNDLVKNVFALISLQTTRNFEPYVRLLQSNFALDFVLFVAYYTIFENCKCISNFYYQTRLHRFFPREFGLKLQRSEQIDKLLEFE